MAVHGSKRAKISYETDRMRFIGRGNTIAVRSDGFALRSLWNTLGKSGLSARSDCRHQVPNNTRSGTIGDNRYRHGIGETRECSLNVVGKYRDRRIADRVFDLAWTQSQVLLRQINATEANAQLYCHIAGSIIFQQCLTAR